MKFYAKAMSVLVKLEFRQKIKCQTSLKRGKTRGKTACREEGIFRKGDAPREGEKGESPDSKGKGTKKGLTGGTKRGKIISTLADTHINMLLLSIAQGETNFNRKF